MTTATREYIIHRRKPHGKQREIEESLAPRKIVKAGRRSGKTVGAGRIALNAFLKQGRRVLYATPTSEQIETFWFEVKRALAEPIEAGIYYKNETEHTIELLGTKQRIRAKTAWNADMLRGDYADLLILDEFQLMSESAWEEVGVPMLLDNNGDAIFYYTPPSCRSQAVSKARDPRYVAKMFAKARLDTTGRWAAFHFTSFDNPFISEDALRDITQDMTNLAYRQEILAEDIEEVPGALWKREKIDALRVSDHPALVRVVVGIDPAVTSNEESDETGILIGGLGSDGDGYILGDVSLRASPHGWASAAATAYYTHQADRVVAEVNNGGDMVGYTLATVDPNIPYKAVHASRGKAIRAEPIAALYEQGRIHHIGVFPELEEQLCSWVPGDKSPDRLDALVWVLTELLLEREDAEQSRYIYEDRVSISPF